MLKEWIVRACEVTIMMKMKAFQKRTVPFGNKWHMASNKKAVTYIHCEIGQYFASFHQPGGSISIHLGFNLLLWNDHFHHSNLPSVTIISRVRENRPTLKTLEIILDSSGSFFLPSTKEFWKHHHRLTGVLSTTTGLAKITWVSP